MHTSPLHGRPVDLAKPTAVTTSLREPGSEDDLGTRLLLTVWGAHAGRWHARVELAGGETHVFDSPFELARFLLRLADGRVSQAAPVVGGGLR